MKLANSNLNFINCNSYSFRRVNLIKNLLFNKFLKKQTCFSKSTSAKAYSNNASRIQKLSCLNKNIYQQIFKTEKKYFSGCGTGCGCHSTKDSNSKVTLEDQLKSMNYDIISCIEDGEYSEGLKLSEEYLSLLKQNYGEEHKLYLSALNNQGFLLKLSGNKSEAKEIYRNILKTYYKLGNVETENIVIVKQNLATILRDLNENTEAISIYEELIQQSKATKMKSNIEINILISASGSYRAIKQFSICNELLDKAESMIEAIYGKDNFPMATLLNQKGLALKDQGKYDEAIKAYKQSLEIKESLLDKTHPEVLITRQNIAQAYIAQGKQQSAMEFLNETEKEIQNSKNRC